MKRLGIRKFTYIFMAAAIALCVKICYPGVYGTVAYAAGNGQDTATTADIVEETDLVMDSKSYVFSNSTDGMFRLSFAEGKSYFIGSARDTDTMITYALIKHASKFYLVVADDSDDNAEYNGSYTDTSFDMLESEAYDSSKRTVKLDMISSDSVSLTGFTYNKDYSVNLTGLYGDIYYENGQSATGICVCGDYYNYYVSGKLVFADGWYKYGSSSPTGELTDEDILESIGSEKIKYVQLFEGHVVSTYHGEHFYSYTGTNKALAKGMSVTINNIKVLYNSKGNAYFGLRKTGSGLYYYEAGIPRKNVLRKSGKDYYYFGKDGRAVSSIWVDCQSYIFHFSDKYTADRVFYTDGFEDSAYAGKLYTLAKGSWKSTATGIISINGTYYYFVNGKKYNGTKWYVKSALCRYYIKGGNVKYAVKPDGIRYRCYIPAENGKWIPAKNVWIPSYNNVAMHIDSRGKSDVLYYKKTHPVTSYADTYRVFANNCWIKKKNAVLYVPGGYYYFDKYGKLVREPGWKTISQTSAVYISDKVNVTEYVHYDASTGYSIYKSGTKLNGCSEGLKRAVINKKAVYYYSDSNGRCLKSAEKTVDDVLYKFDKYGRCFKTEQISWNYDDWMKRVTKAYLGKTGIYCNVFVANALRYAGGSDPLVDMSVRYTGFSKGGFIINSGNMCSYWANKKVTATAVLSKDGKWMGSKEYNLTADRENFSYDALVPGDVIVYYTDGEPTHVGIYFGKFKGAKAVKEYLRKLGISATACEAYVHDWGSDSGNKPEYWVIQGGMGSSDQVYISNSAYDLSGQYAKKIIHIRH